MLFRKNRKQFESLVLKEIDALFRLALRLTGNRSAADDLVQETLLRAYKAFDHFKIQEFGVKPWLFKILHHVYFNTLSNDRRHPVLKDEPIWNLLADHHPENWMTENIEQIDWEQFDEEIKRGIDTLEPEHRMVLLLWSLEQLSYKEIAEICNVPIGTVMSRLFRARKELAMKLTSYANTNRFSDLKGPNLSILRTRRPSPC
jgi:RNA polymerase sigma-70 factor (ECF subfamily)